MMRGGTPVSSGPLFAFDHKLSWDGLLTFFGGLLALLGIWWQMRRADGGLREQLQSEKDVRARERHRRNKATATAILFEIDEFYRSYVRDALVYLEDTNKQGEPPPAVQTPGSKPFPVFDGNCQQLGAMNEQLVEAVVRFYGQARAFVSTLTEYADKYRKAYAAGDMLDWARTKSFLPRVKSECTSLIPVTFISCSFLCEYTGIPFEKDRVAVSVDSHVADSTREAARKGVEELRNSVKTKH